MVEPQRPGLKLYRQVIYAVPTFSNPSGRTMSLKRRQDLVRLARQHDALIITDDGYDFLQWHVEQGKQSPMQTALVPRLVDVDREMQYDPASRPDGFGNTVSNVSFSKIVGPGCRMGWVEGTEKFTYGLSQLGSRKSGGAPSQLGATLITQMIASGRLQKHICDVLQPAYASRYQAMMQAIDTYLRPLQVTVSQAELDGIFGGYFLWFNLPHGLDADQVAKLALDNECLTLGSGSLFSVSGDDSVVDLSYSIRLCFAWEDEVNLLEGVRRLARVIDSLNQQ